MVFCLGQDRLIPLQYRRSKGNILSLPRFGYSVRKRLISTMILSSHSLFLLLLGALLPLFRASSLPPPPLNFFCQRNKVRFLTLNASSVARVPYFCQKASVRQRSFAFSLIIYRNRITRSHVEMKPLVPLNLLKILTALERPKSAICI